MTDSCWGRRLRRRAALPHIFSCNAMFSMNAETVACFARVKRYIRLTIISVAVGFDRPSASASASAGVGQCHGIKKKPLRSIATAAFFKGVG